MHNKLCVAVIGLNWCRVDTLEQFNKRTEYGKIVIDDSDGETKWGPEVDGGWTPTKFGEIPQADTGEVTLICFNSSDTHQLSEVLQHVQDNTQSRIRHALGIIQ